MMTDTHYNILIVGVGGQGVLLASELISHTAMNAGLDVKKSEVHGMSQRGIPAIVTASKDFTYPRDAIDLMRKKTDNLISVEADQLAAELGNPRLVNTILLGILSNHLSFTQDEWTATMQSKIKARLVDINLKAFQRGRDIQLTTKGT